MYDLRILVFVLATFVVFPTDSTDGDDDDDEDVENCDAILEMKVEHGRNLMHSACKYGHIDLIKFLHGKCPKLVEGLDEIKMTPYHMACKKNHVDVIQTMRNTMK